jgi:hypothetical protein
VSPRLTNLLFCCCCFGFHCSYRNAMVRLRKKGAPEFDISSERLQFRPRIEDEIDKMMNECNFQRVKETERTEWNRSLRLYERKE